MKLLVEQAALRDAGSGKPFGMSGSAPQETAVTLEEVNERKDAVLAKWGFASRPDAEGE